jgi:hypothetical protein
VLAVANREQLRPDLEGLHERDESQNLRCFKKKQQGFCNSKIRFLGLVIFLYLVYLFLCFLIGNHFYTNYSLLSLTF